MLALICVLALCACQPLPRPFQGDVNLETADSLLAPGPHSGVLIKLASGTVIPVAVKLRDAVAEALQERDVPAFTRSSNLTSYVLICHIPALKSEDGAVTELTLHWTLKNAKGKLLDSFIQTRVMSVSEWLDSSPDTLAMFAGLVADRVAIKLGTIAGLEPTRPLDAGAGAWATIFIAPVAGAPGDGGQTLLLAMQSRLSVAQVRLAAQPGGTALILQGEVATRDITSSVQQLDVVWRLLDAKGEEIGTVTQSGDVPREVLAGSRGPLATTIADYGAAGILDLLRQVHDSGKPD